VYGHTSYGRLPSEAAEDVRAAHPHPPVSDYNSREREVSARQRRFQYP
jgi:hypothetical protein